MGEFERVTFLFPDFVGRGCLLVHPNGSRHSLSCFVSVEYTSVAVVIKCTGVYSAHAVSISDFSAVNIHLADGIVCSI